MLIRRILNGDKDAFETLVKKHYGNIHAYCYRRTGDEQVAADLTQEVFLKLVASIYNYRFSGKFSNYLFTIAVNVVTDYFKKRKPAAEFPEEDIPSSADTPEQTAVKNERDRVLYDRLRGLPDFQREAIILHYFHGLKARDIAKITGVPLATVKSRLKQGLDKLRKIYERSEPDE